MSFSKIRAALIIAVLLYFIGLFVIWIGGGYVLTASGKVREFYGIPTHISTLDLVDWQPLFGHCQPRYTRIDGRVVSQCDLIGKLYYPFLVMIKRGYPEYFLIDENGEIVISPELPDSFKYHPLRGGTLKEVFPMESNDVDFFRSITE